MTIYKIATPEVASGESTVGVVHQQFAASNKAARGAKKELAEKHGVKPSEMDVSEVDIRKGKAGLIEYLNGFHAEVPASYKPAGYVGRVVMKKPKGKKKK